MLLLWLSASPALPAPGVPATQVDDLLGSINVKEQSLGNPNIALKENACGVASATMMVDYYQTAYLEASGHLPVTSTPASIDEVAQYVRENAAGTRTDWLQADLVTAEAALHSDFPVTEGWKQTDSAHWLAALHAELDHRLPVILFIPDGHTLGWSFHWGHFIVVSGYTDDDTVIYHDPFDGATHTKHSATFEAAWGTPLPANNPDKSWTFSYLEVLPPGVPSPLPTATTSTTRTTPPPATPSTAYIGKTDATLHALNLSDGSPKWTFSTGGMSATALAAGNGLVYVEPLQGVDVSVEAVPPIYGVNAATGSQVWQWSPATPPQPMGFGPPGNFLALSGNTLYATSSASAGDDTLVTLDATTGQPRWQHVISAMNWGFAFDRNTAYVSHDDGGSSTTVDAYNAATGNPIWHQTIRGTNSYGAIAAADGSVYVGVCIQGDAACSSLIVQAFAGQSGSPLWQHDTGAGSTIGIDATGGHVFVRSDGTDQSQGVTILDARIGSALPGVPVGCQWTDVYQTTGDAYETCSLANPGVVAFDLMSGQQHWLQQSFNNGGQTYISIVAVSNGVVYVDDQNETGAEGGNQAIQTGYALDAHTGAIRWHMDGQIGAAVGSVAIVAGTDGSCTAMSASDNTAHWTFQAGTIQNSLGPGYYPPVFIG
jgi:outer membrane protein assembly factor BamB